MANVTMATILRQRRAPVERVLPITPLTRIAFRGLDRSGRAMLFVDGIPFGTIALGLRAQGYMDNLHDEPAVTANLPEEPPDGV